MMRKLALGASARRGRGAGPGARRGAGVRRYVPSQPNSTPASQSSSRKRPSREWNGSTRTCWDFLIDVAMPNGQVEKWAIEAGTPNVLFRRGFTKADLMPGTEIVVDGYRAKDGSRRANGRDLTLPDGRTLFLGSSGTRSPDEAKRPN